MEDSIPRLLLLIVLILASAFFAAAETSYSYANNVRIHLLAEEGDARAKRVEWICDRFDRCVVTLLIAINILHVVASAVATVLAVKLMGNVGSVIATIVLTIIVFLFSENIPKNIAKANADKFSMIISLPMTWFIYLLWPFASFFMWIGNGVKKLIRVESNEPSLTEEEFSEMVESVEDDGLIDPEETEIIKSTIEFGDLSVKEVMTPLNNISAIPIDVSLEDLQKIVISEKYSRFPVYKKDLDHIVAVLQATPLLYRLANNQEIKIKELITRPYFVDPETRIDDVFSGMGRRRTHFAVVRNSNGKTIGVITMEDIVEEIVGEIYDEDDEITPNKEAKK